MNRFIANTLTAAALMLAAPVSVYAEQENIWQITPDGWAVQDSRCLDPSGDGYTCQYIYAGTDLTEQQFFQGQTLRDAQRLNPGMEEFVRDGVTTKHIALVMS